jgi:hypothetical protein
LRIYPAAHGVECTEARDQQADQSKIDRCRCGEGGQVKQRPDAMRGDENRYALGEQQPAESLDALMYSKWLNPAEYFRSPNDDTPCRQFLSLARAALIQSDHVSGRAATARRKEPSNDLRFIRPSSF